MMLWFVIVGLIAGAGVLWLSHKGQLVLRLPTKVPVSLPDTIPLRAAIQQDVDVTIKDEVGAQIRLGELHIPLDETLEIPLDLKLQVPVDAEMSIDQPVELSLDVPISTVLTEHEIDLNHIEVPIGDVHIDDYVDIESTVRIDAPVQTALGIMVPIKADLPIRTRVRIQQPLRIVNKLKLNLSELQIPIEAKIPVKTSFQLRQAFRVRGSVEVPLNQRIAIPVRKTITAAVPDDVSVSVKVPERVRARLDAQVHADVDIERAIPTYLGAIEISAENLRLETRHAANAASPSPATSDRTDDDTPE